MLAGAQQRYEGEAPQFYPEATYIPASSETETGLAGITAAAQQGSPIANAGQQEFYNTLQGGYLSPDSNPFLQQTINAATRPITQQYQEAVVPGINSTFSLAGRYGSDAQVSAQNRALDTYLTNLGETGSRLAYQNYGDERNRQAAATLAAPDYANRRYDDYRTLLDVGAQREGYAGNALQDAMARYDFGQNQPQQKLNEYAGTIRQGVFGGNASTTQTTPYFRGGSAATSALGGAATGASVGSAAGPYGALIGAGVGALGGYASQSGSK